MADGGEKGSVASEGTPPTVPPSQPRSPVSPEAAPRLVPPASKPKKPTPKAKAPTTPKKSGVLKATLKKPSAPPTVFKRPSAKDKKDKEKTPKTTTTETSKDKEKTDKNKKKRAAAKKKEEEEAAQKKAAAEAAKKKTKGGSKGLKDEGEKEEACQEEGGEEEKEEVDPLYEDGATFQEEGEDRKDRVKDRKFKSLLQSNSLPEHIVQEWNRIKLMKVGRQKEERKLVNAVFDRSKTGELLLATSKPQFQLLKQQVDKEVSSSKEKSLPKSLFKGKFHLSEEDFQLGLQSGDFFEVQENGKTQFAWHSSEHQKSKEQLRKRELSKTAELNEAQAKLARHHIGKWSLKCFSTSASSSSIGTSQQTQLLPLEDRVATLTEKQWQTAQGQLLDALQALGKLETSGKKMLQSIGMDNKEDPIYPELFLGLPYSRFC